MSALNTVNREDYSKFDRMSTEALAELLRLDVQSPTEESLDIETILHISEVIAQREKENPSGLYPTPDTDAAWERFQTQYRPYVTGGRSLYDFDDDCPDKPAPTLASQTDAKRKRTLRWFGRIAAIAAALLVALTATAYAMGYDLWRAIAKWGKGTFTFISESVPDETANTRISVPTNKVKYDSLQDALDAYGITTPLAPTWIPEGLTLNEVVVAESSLNNAVRFQSLYTNDETYLSIYISIIRDEGNTGSSAWEKDDASINVFNYAGKSFYLLQNTEDPLLVWRDGIYEGSIAGNIPLDEMMQIAKSIYEEDKT